MQRTIKQNRQDTKAPREPKARDSANCPTLAWCLGVLVVEGLDEVCNLDSPGRLKKL
jgi:hypothetical protein